MKCQDDSDEDSEEESEEDAEAENRVAFAGSDILEILWPLERKTGQCLYGFGSTSAVSYSSVHELAHTRNGV